VDKLLSLLNIKPDTSDLKYQKPELVDLAGMDSFDLCADGSVDAGSCSNGAVANDCYDGNTATFHCTDGDAVLV
jgi:hypothetical protein